MRNDVLVIYLEAYLTVYTWNKTKNIKTLILIKYSIHHCSANHINNKFTISHPFWLFSLTFRPTISIIFGLLEIAILIDFCVTNLFNNIIIFYISSSRTVYVFFTMTTVVLWCLSLGMLMTLRTNNSSSDESWFASLSTSGECTCLWSESLAIEPDTVEPLLQMPSQQMKHFDGRNDINVLF